MKKYLCFIVLIACVLCASRKTDKERDPKARNEVRNSIIDCILKNEGISQTLKNHVENVKNSDDRIPLHFSKVELPDTDRDIIKECKREVFKARRKRAEREEEPAL